MSVPTRAQVVYLSDDAGVTGAASKWQLTNILSAIDYYFRNAIIARPMYLEDPSA